MVVNHPNFGLTNFSSYKPSISIKALPSPIGRWRGWSRQGKGIHLDFSKGKAGNHWPFPLFKGVSIKGSSQ